MTKLLFIFLIIFQACVIRNPKVENVSSMTADFSHNTFLDSCVSCHENIRPSTPHTTNSDCISCHTTTSWTATLAFTHNPTPASCISCHAQDRPMVTTGHNSKLIGHYSSIIDCSTCHAISESISTTSWQTGAYISCILCHLTTGQNQHGTSAIDGGSHSKCDSCHNPTRSSW